MNLTLKLRGLQCVLYTLFFVQALSANSNPGTSERDWKHRSYALIGINGGCNLAIQPAYQWHFLNYKGEGKEQRIFDWTIHAGLDLQILPQFGIAPNLSVRFATGNNYSDSFYPMIGTDYLLYTNLKGVNQVFRPIAGFQTNAGGSLSYGYNFQLDSQPCILPTRHSIQLTIPIWIPFILLIE